MAIKSFLNSGWVLKTSLTKLAIRIGGLLSWGMICAFWAAGASGGQLNYSSKVQGTVTDRATGLPIPNASIDLPGLVRSAQSDPDGSFLISEIILPAEITTTSLVIHAEHYGDWSLTNVPLLDADTLIIDAQLESAPITINLPDMGIREREPKRILSPRSEPAPPSINQMNAPLPSTIRVRITGQQGTCDPDLPYTVEVVQFNDYVKHVLPYEWLLGWPRESLRAGAMAAKMYAWTIVANGGRYEDADVYDSICDQVYIPGVTYSSTNNAIDFTWNWRLTESDGSLFLTHYLDWYWRCEDFGWQGYCIGQWDTFYHATGNNGREKLTWDEMLFEYYWNSQMSYVPILPPGGFLLRFFGNAWGDYDRVKIMIDDPAVPADIGGTDFTIEWWMLAALEDNPTPSCTSGGDNWTEGNTIFDRDVSGSGDYGEYGISLAGGLIAFGVNNGSESETLCGTTSVADGIWHHIAVTRTLSDGEMKLFVDGVLDAESLGPAGDITYRDGRSTTFPEQDPYLVIGARKSDQGQAFNGLLDEIRLSDSLRYTEPFIPQLEPFNPDPHTMALYHFDEGFGNTLGDSSGGGSNGVRIYGGDPNNGPEWMESYLYLFHNLYIPMVVQ